MLDSPQPTMVAPTIAMAATCFQVIHGQGSLMGAG